MNNGMHPNTSIHEEINGEGFEAEALALAVARQYALEGKVTFLRFGSKVFEIEKGWQSRLLNEAKTIRSVVSAGEFLKAIQMSDVYTIFIPVEAAISDFVIEDICDKHAIADKTIIREVNSQ